MTSLLHLQAGAQARLVQLNGERSLRRRLMEMGLLPGTPVRLVRKVAVGDLVELEVRGCHISLRRAEAGQLLVENV